MSFYRKIGRWAAGMEKDRLKRKLRNERKAETPVTKAFLFNELHSLEGQIGRWFSETGGMLVQRYDEIIGKRLGDTVAVCSELMRQQAENMQSWIDGTYRLYDNAQRSYFKDMSKQLEANERNDSGRFLALSEKQDVLQGTMIGLFENLTEQVQALKQPHETYEPSVKWMIDNVDNIIRFGIAMEALRDNNAPASIAMVEAVKSFRTMFDVDMFTAKKALDDVAREWGVVEQAA